MTRALAPTDADVPSWCRVCDALGAAAAHLSEVLSTCPSRKWNNPETVRLRQAKAAVLTATAVHLLSDGCAPPMPGEYHPAMLTNYEDGPDSR
jgi:hypothetical protein